MPYLLDVGAAARANFHPSMFGPPPLGIIPVLRQRVADIQGVVMASENARANSSKATRIKNNLNAQLRELQSLEAEIKRRDGKDLDEVARAEQIAKAAAQVRSAITTLDPATKGPPSRGLFG
jgi:hypothetical protein